MNTTTAALRLVAKTVDEALVPLWIAQEDLDVRRLRVRKALSRVIAGKSLSQAVDNAVAEKRITALKDEVGEIDAKLEDLRAEAAPLAALAVAGKWTRFVLVPAGHLHKGFGCSTLRWTTQTGLMPEYSGADEAEIVALAGEAACTVCFPSAPVTPSMLPIHVKSREEKAALAAEKAEKKVVALAAQIVVGRKVYKTQRGAENQISWEIESVVSRRYMPAADADHRARLDEMAAEDLAAARKIADAIAETVEGYSADEILAKKFATKVKEYRRNGWEIPADASL
jgi:hypothetical protein